jgi:hypothetical protein
MLAVLLAAWQSVAAPITVGNLVVARVGDGSAALSTAATAVFLEEFTPTGTLVQTIPLSSAGAAALTFSGNATTEGILGRSQDGNSIVFLGYRKDAGGTNPSADLGTLTPRVVATVGLSGVVDTTTTALMDAVSGSARSAISVDGSTYYIGTSTGVRWAASPAATTTTLIDNRNSRQVLLSGNTLFASNGSTGTTQKVQSYGTLPTVATVPTAVVNLTTADAVNGFLMLDLNPGVAGDDTIYLCSTVENLLRKYTFDGTSWLSNGSISAGGTADLTGFVDGLGNVNLFLTSGAGLFPYTDTSGIGGMLSGSLGSSIAAPGINTAFRGIAMFIPEPSALGVLGLCLVGLLRRR